MADQVAVDRPSVVGWQEAFDSEAKPFPELVLRIRNDSAGPISNVRLRIEAGIQGTFVRDLQYFARNTTQEIRIAVPARPRSEQVLPEIAFRDAQGKSWLITVGQELKQIEHIPDWHTNPGAYTTENHPTLAMQSQGYEVV